LFEAILRDNRATVKELLNKNSALANAAATVASCETQIEHWVYAEDTALHVAAIFNQPSVIERLLAAGAEVNARNATGFTPLMYASHFHQLDCVRLLVRAGADRRLKNDAGLTPVQLARQANAANIVSFLDGLDR
jgi:hypothetical protein